MENSVVPVVCTWSRRVARFASLSSPAIKPCLHVPILWSYLTRYFYLGTIYNNTRKLFLYEIAVPAAPPRQRGPSPKCFTFFAIRMRRYNCRNVTIPTRGEEKIRIIFNMYGENLQRRYKKSRVIFK